MMKFDNTNDRLQSLFVDYPFHLYCINEETDFSVFHTELRQVFELLQCRRNKAKLWEIIGKRPEYQHMDADTLEVLSVLLNMPALWKDRKKYMKKSEEQEEYNMCQALEELFADARNEGIEIGMKTAIEDGKKALEEKTRQIIANMLNRGMTDEDIMAIAECSKELIDTVRNKNH